MSSIGRTELSILAQECLNDHDVIISLLSLSHE